MVLSRAIGAAAVVVAAGSTSAFASALPHLGITQVDGMPLPKVTYDVPVITDPIDGPGKTSVTVGAAAPVQTAISNDPTDLWIKNFSWDVNNRGVFNGDQINLCEYFEINLNEDGVTPRNIPITDWHEQIFIETTAPINGTLQFVDGFIEFDFGSGFVSPNLVNTGAANGGIWFDWSGSDLGGVNATDGDFNSVVVKITKVIEYQGTGIAPGALGDLDFSITEYPTPTPGTVVPLAMMGLFARRRR